MAKAKKTAYVDGTELRNEIIEYNTSVKMAKEDGKPKPQMPDSLGSKILLIAERVSMRPNFYNYTYRDEMISDGVENCIMYIHNYDPEKSSYAFAYITQIIWYAFLRRIGKEKKQAAIKFKCLENASGFKLYEGGRVLENMPNEYQQFLQKLQITVEDVEKYESPQKKTTKKPGKSNTTTLNEFVGEK